MSLFKRTVALILVTAMLLSLLCVCVYSADRMTASVSGNMASFSVKIDEDKLISYLEENLLCCPGKLDVSSFGIPYTTQDTSALQRLIWHGTPVLFHVLGLGFWGSNGIVTHILFTYHYTEAQYRQMYEACVNKASELTSDLKNNKAIDDVTKALILHDRIIAGCEYDLVGVTSGNISNESQEMYGALIDGVATCQGYSFAYMYLLREVGIDSYICTSSALNHDWNIVIINGKKYHVDVTFDDPVYDVTGRVYHDYFMLSTSALKKGEHSVVDYDTSPTDTTYDNYYWKNSRAEFQLIDNKLYYIDNIKETLNRVGSSTPLRSLSDAWMTADGNFWKGNFSRLTSDGNNLLYSLSKGVYQYDLSTLTVKQVYAPTLTGMANQAIYGFTYDSGYLVLDLYNRPDFDANTKNKYQIRVPYDLVPPAVAMSCTNDVSAFQTLSLTFTDNVGVVGYYWGTDPVHTGNDYVSVTKNTGTQYVSKAGTYYITAKDSGGNLSDTLSLTFYETKLDATGGNVSVPTVITVKGKSFLLPEPVRKGYEFVGWGKSDAYPDAVEVVAPTSNSVYYAHWKQNDSYIPDYDTDYTNRFTDVSDTAWYADAVAYCAQRGYINGITQTLFSPGSYLTREQFVLILANVAGVDSTGYKYADSGMKDVPVGKWYSGAIAWGVSEGYVKGVSSDRFGLRQNITREQLARLFYVYAEDKGMDVNGRADISRFADAKKVSDWALDSVRWAVDRGIISGMTQTLLGPRGNATRAQTARMFMIFDKLT